MPALERWMPRDLDVVERRIRRVFEDLGVASPPPPAADVYETETEYVVELEVPGFDAGDLDVEVFDHTLRVRGERTAEKEETERSVFRRERLESTFERRFDLPRGVDSEQLTAMYGKGLLTLHVPKVAEVLPRKVEISPQ